MIVNREISPDADLSLRPFLSHGHLPLVGPLDDGDHLIDALLEAPCHPDPFDGFHACDDILAPIFLLHRVIRPLRHGIRQEDGEFIPDHLLDTTKIHRDENIRMSFDELHMMPQLLQLGHAHDLFFVLSAQDIQPELHHILLQVEISIEGLPPDGRLLADLRDGDLLEGLALHQAEQGIGDHMLALHRRFVDLFVIHFSLHCVSCAEAIEFQFSLCYDTTK